MSSEGLDPSTQRYLELTSEHVINTFEVVSAAADAALRNGRPLTSEAFGTLNTFNSDVTRRIQDRINSANQESYQHLKREPAIARVVVESDCGKQTAYYFCRCEQGIPRDHIVSYRAPMGRIAALEVGDDYTLSTGETITVIEQAMLRPSLSPDGWDAVNTVIETLDFGPITVESLRRLLKDASSGGEADDILGELLAEDGARSNIHEGMRRAVISKMGLRDQPVLDKYQDEIFRLPLNQRLLILGPPGTGKTTTLIRRLGQKLDSVYLEEDEQAITDSIAKHQGIPHARSWIMFTPTELLKQYVKEAFASEGISAPDQQITTWNDYRRRLARRTFGVLRTSTGSGTFVLREDLDAISTASRSRPIEWFDDFDASQQKLYVQELREAAGELSSSELTGVADLGARLLRLLPEGDTNMAALLGMLVREIPNVQSIVDQLKAVTDKSVRSALSSELKEDRTFLHQLAQHLDTHTNATGADNEEFDAEDDEEAVVTTPLSKALSAFNSSVKAQAIAAASNRAVGRSTRAGKILDWLGPRSLPESDRAAVGRILLAQSAGRRFLNPVKRYIGDIPKRYRTFRRERLQEGGWYQAVSLNDRDVSPLEVDIVLLSILRSGAALTMSASVRRDIDSPAWSSLKPVMELYRTQVLVDEATDFSPIQLACMAAMADPTLRSFFACGDFNQRLTSWGTRTFEEIRWVAGDIGLRSVNVGYRQSKPLNELANAILAIPDGAGEMAALSDFVDSDGMAPALLENSHQHDPYEWIAHRVREIDRFYGQLPSIAIFVNTEADVVPTTDALSAALSDDNVRVVACHEGQAVGQENDIRVFHIEHIKGLEFESAFLIGVDQLADMAPDLFEKYLYVGITRAATYLGITCNRLLPQKIRGLSHHFCTSWAAY